ncbi:MAG TPA: rhodanese-like domain-containing protein [Anaeromyxobacteraceae bacterium]|nr:rhodanese-like domain-containing protein [Anaeromyxobacteraceae bacterium]
MRKATLRRLALALALLAGCATAHPTPEESAAAEALRIDGPTAFALAQRGARIIDVRRPDEYAAGHIPGAVNIPYDEVAVRTSEVGSLDTEVIVYCRTGRRSAVAAETLVELGYRHVHDLGPMSAWPAGPQALPQ